MKKTKTVEQILEEVREEICDKYCKYPEQTPPEGKDDDWLMDDDSPCLYCPMSRL